MVSLLRLFTKARRNSLKLQKSLNLRLQKQWMWGQMSFFSTSLDKLRQTRPSSKQRQIRTRRKKWYPRWIRSLTSRQIKSQLVATSNSMRLLCQLTKLKLMKKILGQIKRLKLLWEYSRSSSWKNKQKTKKRWSNLTETSRINVDQMQQKATRRLQLKLNEIQRSSTLKRASKLMFRQSQSTWCQTSQPMSEGTIKCSET